jgi:hypothetical protein
MIAPNEALLANRFRTLGIVVVARDPALNPGIAGNQLSLWESEVLHQSPALGVFAEICAGSREYRRSRRYSRISARLRSGLS